MKMENYNPKKENCEEGLEIPIDDFNKGKSNFISAFSHEISMPLTMLITSVSILKKNHMDEMTDSAKGYVDVIDKNVSKIYDLMNNLIGVSRIYLQDDYAIKLQSVDIVEFLNKCADSIKGLPKLDGYKINFSSNKERFIVMFDVFLGERIVANLISNSFKYSGTKEVFLNLQINQNNFVVEVVDCGRGFSEDPQFLLNAFVRGKETAGTSGMGIGLSIVKTYVEALEGTVSMHSQKNEGTKVILTFPIKESVGKEVKLSSNSYEYTQNLIKYYITS